MGLKRVRAEGYANQPEFFVAERTEAIEKFPCNKCHNKPMEQLRRAQQGKKAAHWEVKLVHAAKTVMDCDTCHLKDDLDSLATLKKDRIHVNHAYQLCAQCHSRQAADWAGGAHGKRLSGWAPPRVVSSCTGCHNPHQPKLEPRMPVLARQEGTAMSADGKDLFPILAAQEERPGATPGPPRGPEDSQSPRRPRL